MSSNPITHLAINFQTHKPSGLNFGFAHLKKCTENITQYDLLDFAYEPGNLFGGGIEC
jgi:hypothetical protein